MNKKLIYTIIAAICVTGIVGVSIAFLTSAKESHVEDTEKESPAISFREEPETLDEAGFDGAFSLLVIGSDSREGQRYQDGVEGELNDVTILLKVDETHQRADIISFPRDAIVPMGVCTGADPSGDYRQINTGLSLGGPDCVRSSIENLTGEKISGTALVSFNAVEDLTEAVGGVPVCIAEPVYSYHTGDLMFEAGEHKLSGEKALSFVRERYGFGDGGDLGRVYNQQVFLQAFLKEFRKADFMTSPAKFWKLADAALSNLELSENLRQPASILKLTNTFLEVPAENYQFYTAPVSDNAEDPNRLDINYELLDELIDYTNMPPLTVETEPASDGTSSVEEESSGETEVILPVKPETLPDSDVYAPKTGESSTVTVCG